MLDSTFRLGKKTDRKSTIDGDVNICQIRSDFVARIVDGTLKGPRIVLRYLKVQL